MAENRKHARVPSEFLVRIRVGDSGESFEGQALNLSRGGVFIRSDGPLPKGTSISLEMKLVPIGKVAYVEAVVVWTRPKMPDPNFPAGMGVKFVEISDENQGLIDETVEKLAPKKE